MRMWSVILWDLNKSGVWPTKKTWGSWGWLKIFPPQACWTSIRNHCLVYRGFTTIVFSRGFHRECFRWDGTDQAGLGWIRPEVRPEGPGPWWDATRLTCLIWGCLKLDGQNPTVSHRFPIKMTTAQASNRSMFWPRQMLRIDRPWLQTPWLQSRKFGRMSRTWENFFSGKKFISIPVGIRLVRHVWLYSVVWAINTLLTGMRIRVVVVNIRWR